MAVPFRRTSKSKKNKRRSHDAIKVKNFSVSKETGFPTLKHRACRNTGKYRGKEIIVKQAD